MSGRASANLGSVQFDVVVDDDDVSGMFARFDSVLEAPNLAQFLRRYATPWFRGKAGAGFEDEMAPNGQPWSPLKPYTVETRESEGFPGDHPINHRTGAMERYIMQGTPSMAVGAMQATMRFPGRGSALFNRKLKVAQQGAKWPRTVARPVVGMDERDLAVMLRSLSLWIGQEMTFGGSLEMF